jgi:hypothetical protein
MATLEEEVRELTAQIKAMVGKGGPTPADGNKLISGVSGAITGLTDSFAKLTFGTYNLQNGLGDFSTIVSKLGGSLGTAFGDIIKKVGNEAIYLNTALNDAGKSGINFDNNLGEYAAALGSARISVPQFAQILQENSAKITGLAGNAQESANRFLETGKAFAESPAVRQLNATGVGMEELNRILTISATNRRNLDFSDENVRKRAAQSAADMAVEMDNVARLTGINRQEQEKALQAQLRKTEVELILASMNEDEKAAYEKSTLQLAAFGPKFQDALTIVTTGGVRTAEDNMKVAAMGPKMFGLVEEMSKIKGNTAADAEERNRIITAMSAESSRVAGDREGLKSMAVLSTGAGAIGKEMGETTVGVVRFGTTIRKVEADLAKENAERLAKRQEQISLGDFLEARERENAAKRKAAEESLQPGNLINRAEGLIKDASAGVAAGFKGLNSEAANFAGTFKGLNEALKPLTTEAAKDAFKHMVRNALPNQVDTEKLTGKAKEKADAERARQAEPRAEGGGMFGNMPYLVGEVGPEIGSFNKDSNLLSNKNLRSLFGEADTDLRNATSSLQSEMRSKIADLKSSTLTADQLEQAMTRVTSALPKQLPQMPQDNTASNELIKHVQQLNTQVRELITAVVDGSSANVKAVRTSGGNMIA